MEKQATLLDQLKESLSTDPEKAFEYFKSNFIEDIDEFKKEYKGDRTLRQTQVGTRVPKKGSKVNKIPFSFQKKIVKIATSFLFAKPIDIEMEDEAAQEIIDKVWNDNRMDTLIQKFTRILKSETEAVFFVYVQEKEGEDKRLRIKLYTSENGQYSPLYDEYGDLIAFMWKYKTIIGDDEIENVWIFLNEATLKYQKTEGGWSLIDTLPNISKKIPVVFMRQDDPEWWEVKELIDRYEMGYSRFCDTNDYFGSPMVVTKGKVQSMPDKEKQGKMINIPRQVDGLGNDMTGDVSYLTWQHAPESTKLEWEVGKQAIHDQTSTPDVSFSNLKGIAPASGLAMLLQFMDAELKALESQGDFAEMIERIITLILHNSVDGFKPKEDKQGVNIRFNSPLPNADTETIENLMVATGNKPIVSQETGVKLNPMIEHPKEELSKIEAESKKNLGESYEV